MTWLPFFFFVFLIGYHLRATVEIDSSSQVGPYLITKLSFKKINTTRVGFEYRTSD